MLSVWGCEITWVAFHPKRISLRGGQRQQSCMDVFFNEWDISINTQPGNSWKKEGTEKWSGKLQIPSPCNINRTGKEWCKVRIFEWVELYVWKVFILKCMVSFKTELFKVKRNYKKGGWGGTLRPFTYQKSWNFLEGKLNRCFKIMVPIILVS